jgi:hypothetical protein
MSKKFMVYPYMIFVIVELIFKKRNTNNYDYIR